MRSLFRPHVQSQRILLLAGVMVVVRLRGLVEE